MLKQKCRSIFLLIVILVFWFGSHVVPRRLCNMPLYAPYIDERIVIENKHKAEKKFTKTLSDKSTRTTLSVYYTAI